MRRRSLLTAALAGAGATVTGVGLSSPASAAIAYGADVKRSVTIERAKDWWDRNIPYNDGAYTWDVNKGRKYRQDCSGFVAMCWKMNGDDPDGSYGIFTGNLDQYSHRIDWNDLLPGDALLLKNEHVKLFEKWANPATKADFWIYEEGRPATDMNHYSINVVELRQAGYVPMRYDHIIKG